MPADLSLLNWAKPDVPSPRNPYDRMMYGERPVVLHPDDKTCVTGATAVSAMHLRILKSASKNHVKFLQARAFLEALIAADGSNKSKAELARRFGKSVEKLMEKPEVLAEIKRVIYTYDMTPDERKKFLKAKTNQIAIAPDTVPDADRVMRALKLMQDQEGAGDERPAERPISITLPAELFPAPPPKELPQAEVIEARDLMPEKEA